jgi:Protein of unknown function (DUF1579)
MNPRWSLAAGLLLLLCSRSLSQQADAARPGPVHQQLAKLAGEYTTVSKFQINPSATAQESQGTSKITSILGGRFLMQDNRGQLLGQAAAGLHLIGYNNGAKQYEGTWVYTGSTSIMQLTGTSEDRGKTIELTGTYEMEKGRKTTLTVIMRFIDEDHFTEDLIAKTPDGKKGPTLETSYTRKK